MAAPGAASVAGTSCKQVYKLGFVYSSDEGQALAVFGTSPSAAANTTNYEKEVATLDQRLTDYVNSHGGLGPGCKVAVALHDFHILGSDGFSGETQTECADFAEDQHVFAVVSTIAEETQSLIPCLAGHGVPVFYSGNWYPFPQDFARYRGYLYQPDSITPARMGSFMDILKAQGYLGAGAKVGILLSDDGSGHNQYVVNTLWTPRLKAMGITPVVYTFTQGSGDQASLSKESGQFQAAVLQFKAAGVNRLIMTPDASNAEFLFPPQAAAQNWHPRYAFTSDNGPAVWSTAAPPERPGAIAISWSLTDVAANSDPARQLGTNPANADRALCNKVFSDQTPANQAAELTVCDNVFLLQAALKGAGSVTPQNLLAGMDRIGGFYSPAGGYANLSLGAPSHYDGATAVRVINWDESTSSWIYSGGPISVPSS